MAILTEADTCRKYVLPKLYGAGWDDDQIPEQRTFTDGRIIAEGLDGLQAKVDTLKKLQEETSKELDALMPSILSNAFSGEL